ncbi:MAG: response regulator [Porphyromonas sp.]|nr:response regulator [Porphyromonas sp.]
MSKEDDKAMILCYKALGNLSRKTSSFSTAIEYHGRGLEIALRLKDTISIVQALNNLGTDFRRIGALSQATEYHYRALTYAESFSGFDTQEGLKNRVYSMNGLGNICLTLGYYDDARKYFEGSLLGETKLESPIGQAINLANLGSVYEAREMFDSAQIYYERSLEQNRLGNSLLGEGLCLGHLGNIYKKQGRYDLAKRFYRQAYDLMYKLSDRWHWLTACMSIAEINHLVGNIAEFDRYIQEAEKTALEINAPEHLADIYMLKHDRDLQQGLFHSALNYYKKGRILQDSILSVQKANRYVELKINYERERAFRQLQHIETEFEEKKAEKERAVYMLWAAIAVGLMTSALFYYAYRQRTRSNRLLKEIESRRTEFFTNITHELRTPLTVIKGLNKQLSDRKDLSLKEQRVYHSAIDRQSDNLLKLVNQLLDIAKLRSGGYDPEWRRGDIAAHLQMIVETFRLYAADKDITLDFYNRAHVLEMDFIPFYIDKVFGNLLSNAIKHTPSGGFINVILTRGGKGKYVQIQVSDTGEGIPLEEQDKIFEVFYQSPNAKNDSGTGIGLSFCKMMVEKMNGKISVQSELNKGSIFTVSLPIKGKGSLKAIAIEKNSLSSTLLPDTMGFTYEEEGVVESSNLNDIQPIVLIVEDNNDVALYLKSILRDRYNLLFAQNGEEGLELAEKHIPDIIVTDVMMPLMDGFELCQRVRESILLNHIPIIVLTAKASEQDRLKGLNLGVEEYLYKPFKPEELQIRIKNILDSRRLLKEKYRMAIDKENDSEPRELNDRDMKFVQKVTDLIYSQLKNSDMNASYLADKIAISPSQLSRKLSALTGHSTMSYVLQIRLSKAKKMLREESLSIIEVAEACGFSDPNYFSRVFKKEVGMPPSQYQKILFDT